MRFSGAASNAAAGLVWSPTDTNDPENRQKVRVIREVFLLFGDRILGLA